MAFVSAETHLGSLPMPIGFGHDVLPVRVHAEKRFEIPPALNELYINILDGLRDKTEIRRFLTMLRTFIAENVSESRYEAAVDKLLKKRDYTDDDIDIIQRFGSVIVPSDSGLFLAHADALDEILPERSQARIDSRNADLRSAVETFKSRQGSIFPTRVVHDEEPKSGPRFHIGYGRPSKGSGNGGRKQKIAAFLEK